MSIVCKASPRVNMMAWFWFSGFPSPISVGGPGSFMRYISYQYKTEALQQSASIQSNSLMIQSNSFIPHHIYPLP